MASSALGLSSRLGTAISSSSDRHLSVPAGSGRVKFGQLRAFASQNIDVDVAFSSASQETGPPTIELEFIAPERGAVGAPQTDTVSVASGEKVLRTVMNDSKLELYGLYGKVMNCGGGGSCGTCTVEIIEGSDLLNQRTDTEIRYLKKKPESWRLACQTIVGDKLNSGKVIVQRLPQRKK